MGRTSDPAVRGNKAGSRLIPLGLILLTLLTFSPTLSHDFVGWDDGPNISTNPDFNPPTFAGLARYWKEPYLGLYAPVTYTAWAGLATLAQLDPGPHDQLNPFFFHAANIILHALNVALVYALVRRLTRHTAAAAVGALVFALHPLQVEPAAWVTGLKDVLSATLGLLALLGYLTAIGREGPAGRPATAYALATLCLLLALLSKPAAVIIPVIAGIIHLTVLDRSLRSAVSTLGPWLALAAAAALLTALVQPAATIVAPPLWARPLIAGDALAFYLRKLLIPFPLGIDHGRTPTTILASGWAYAAWLLPAAVGLLIWRFRQRFPLVAVSALLFVAGVLPVLGLVSFDHQRYSTVADRYIYLSMLGVALAVATLLSLPAGRWKWAIAGVALTTLTALNLLQQRTWRDSPTLFAHTLGVHPDSPIGNQGMAAIHSAAGRPREALPYARAAVRLAPRDPAAHHGLAVALAQAGQPAEALAEFARAQELAPRDTMILYNLAELHAGQGNLPAAIDCLQRALDIDPGDQHMRQTLEKMRQRKRP